MANSGARLSMLPMMMPHWHTATVMISALVGSPVADDLANGCRNGIMSSLAMACGSEGHVVMKFYAERDPRISRANSLATAWELR